MFYFVNGILSFFCRSYLTNVPGGVTIALTKQYYMIRENTVPVWDNYLNVIEASRRLKVHPETVKRLCRQGDLPAHKIHNTWLINKDTLDNFAGTYNPRRGARKRLLE
jgi:excisionase family DNA binding protein